MGWKERQDKYKGITLNSQADEDLVARRVLNGLNLVERQLVRAEYTSFGEADTDEPLWPRVRKLIAFAWYQPGSTAQAISLNSIFSKPVVVPSKEHADVLERIDEWYQGTNLLQPIIMVRKKNTKLSYTYSVWVSETIGKHLAAPFTVIADKEFHKVVVQTTEHFVSQFGPYSWPEYVES